MTLLDFLRPQLPDEDIRVVDDVAIRRLLTDMYSRGAATTARRVGSTTCWRSGAAGGSTRAPSARRSGSGTASRTASPRSSTPTGWPRRSRAPRCRCSPAPRTSGRWRSCPQILAWLARRTSRPARASRAPARRGPTADARRTAPVRRCGSITRTTKRRSRRVCTVGWSTPITSASRSPPRRRLVAGPSPARLATRASRRAAQRVGVVRTDHRGQPAGGLPQPVPRRCPVTLLGEAHRLVDLRREGVRVVRPEHLAQLAQPPGPPTRARPPAPERALRRRDVAHRRQRVRVLRAEPELLLERQPHRGHLGRRASRVTDGQQVRRATRPARHRVRVVRTEALVECAVGGLEHRRGLAAADRSCAATPPGWPERRDSGRHPARAPRSSVS